MASRRSKPEVSPQSEVPASSVEIDEAAEAAGARLDELLEHIAQPTLPAIERPFVLPSEPPPPALRTARVARMTDDGVELVLRGRSQPFAAVLDDGVDRELIARAMEGGDAVLVEMAHGAEPVVVGVVQTRIPQKLELKARDIVLEAEREVVIRAGGAAVRMREDGDVELIGSRILTMSRGLFRIVGRVLRLN